MALMAGQAAWVRWVGRIGGTLMLLQRHQGAPDARAAGRLRPGPLGGWAPVRWAAGLGVGRVIAGLEWRIVLAGRCGVGRVLMGEVMGERRNRRTRPAIRGAATIMLAGLAGSVSLAVAVAPASAASSAGPAGHRGSSSARAGMDGREGQGPDLHLARWSYRIQFVH